MKKYFRQYEGAAILKSLNSCFIPFGRVSKTYFSLMVAMQVILLIFTWNAIPSLFIPKPIQIFNALVELLSGKEFYSDLLCSLFLTGKAMLYSIFIACLFGCLSTIPFFKPLVYAVIRLRFITIIGLVFSFTMVLHGGEEVKLALLMFGIIPYFTISLLSVIDKIEKKEFDLCQTMKFNRWQTMYELIMYGRMDLTLDTIRVNFAMAWLMITTVESLSMSGGGVGVRLHNLDKLNHLDYIFAIQFTIFTFGILFDIFMLKMRYSIFPYTKLNEIK